MDEINKTIKEPMSNTAITQYLKNAKIITNKDLLNYNKLEDVFNPENKRDFLDYVIILFLDKPNQGHWTALNRMGPVIEFFDSYGNPPEKVYDFCPMEIRKQLGTEDNYLCKLLDNFDGKVVYNPIDYQSDKKDVNTCGRHCCYRIITMFGKGFDLNEYYDWMNNAKKYFNYKNYDDVVAKLINL